MSFYFMCLYYYRVFYILYCVLHFIFYYVISIKKCKRDLVILRHCQFILKSF